MRGRFGERLARPLRVRTPAVVGGSACFANGWVLQPGGGGAVLHLHAEEYSLPRAEIEEALSFLRGKDPKRILIGFETIKDRVEGQPVLIRGASSPEADRGADSAAVVQGGSPICVRCSGRSEAGEHVFAGRQKRPPESAQRARVEVRCGGIRSPSDAGQDDRQIRARAARLAGPEARGALGAHGSAGAFPGSVLSGDAPAPRLSIHLRDRTSRDILNAIVLHSSDCLDALGLSFPLSWKYEFIVDPAAPAGPGGRPKWDNFWRISDGSRGLRSRRSGRRPAAGQEPRAFGRKPPAACFPSQRKVRGRDAARRQLCPREDGRDRPPGRSVPGSARGPRSGRPGGGEGALTAGASRPG